MSDSSSTNKYYVATPVASDYESVNEDILTKASKFGVKSHRIVSAVGENANMVDQGATNFKYLEDHLLSTKGIKSLTSIFDADYVSKVRVMSGSTCKVLRFNRSHNIRTFDFIINYTQVSEFSSKIYKTIPVTAQYRGSLLFSGCSIVRDVDTMEELPLKLYAKYESIGDTLNNNVDLNAITDAKGGPGITLAYTFDDDYVYLYVKTISPIRTIPVGDGEFKDISYIEGAGTLIGETKPDLTVISDPVTGKTTPETFAPDTNLWCDITLSLKDTTIAHSGDNAEFVDYDDDALSVLAVTLREQSFTLLPTNDGEQIVIGMEPASTINMEIAPNIKPIRFGTSLLDTSKEDVEDYIEKLSDKIKEAATNIELVPFTIETTIRSKGKYNINSATFIDGQADSFGDVVITDVGTYNSLTDTFNITEYIFDKNQSKYSRISTVEKYNSHVENASDYLNSLSTSGTEYTSTRTTNTLLDILSDLELETPSELNVYFNASFIKSSVNFNVIKAYAEFGDDEDDNSDDNVVYICEDNRIRVVNFKDYNMENISVIDLSKYLADSFTITSVTRSEYDDVMTYFIGTNIGKVIVVKEVVSSNPSATVISAFDEYGNITEEVSLLQADGTYVYIGSTNANISVYTVATDSIEYLKSNFKYGTKLLGVQAADDYNIIFVTNYEICSYNLNTKKWNYEGDEYHISANYDNQYRDLPIPNLDGIIEQQSWKNVPLIQKDNYVYALGLRYDSESGYTEVYKRMNILTGEVISLPSPTNEEQKLYKPALCLDGDIIYCIGGTSISHESDATADKIYTYLCAFDTVKNEWVELPDTKVELGDGAATTSNNQIYPVAHNSVIYLAHPKLTVVSLNANTGAYSTSDQRVYEVYKIEIGNSAITVSTLDDTVNNKFSSSDITIIPTSILDDKIYFYAGTPNLSNSVYNGYYLYQVVLDTTDDSVTTQTSTICTEAEIANDFSGSKYTNARIDLFSDAAICCVGNEMCIYCYYTVVVYILNTSSVLYTESHKIYHNVSGSTYAPLITSGEYEAWQKYNKNSSANTSLIKIKNYIAFFSGDTCRVFDYLALDTMSLIPAPTFYERSSGNSSTSILSNHDDILKVVVDETHTYKELVSCRVDNYMYLIGIENSSTYKAVMLRYELDTPSYQIEVVKDITSIITNDNNPYTYKLVMTRIPDTNYILISSCNCIDSEGTLNYQFCLSSFNTNSFGASRIITNSTKFTSAKIIYPIVISSSEVDYVSDENVGYKVLLTGNVFSTEVISARYSLNNLADVASNSQPIITKSVKTGNYNIFIVPTVNGLAVKRLDVSLSNKTDVDIYTIPRSENYLYPEIFLSDNTIYFTKGMNGELLGNEVFKANITDSGELANLTHTIMSSGSSSVLAPIAISRKNVLYLFGLGRGTEVICKLFHSNIGTNTFVSYYNELEISSSSKSAYNRFNPKFTSFNVDGHELLLVFGGTQSLGTTTTTTIDVFDTERHAWKSDAITLPTTMSHFSVVENVIVGATYEVEESASVKAYAKKVEIECTDYDSLSFTTNVTVHPAINGFSYPSYASYALNSDETLLYIVPTYLTNIINTETRTLYKIDIENSSYSAIADLPEVVYLEARQIVGSFCVENNLCVVVYSSTYNYISVLLYSESSDTWTEVNRVELSFTPAKDKSYESTTYELGLNIFSVETNIINGNFSISDVKAIITALDETGNDIHTTFICNDSGTLSVSDDYTYTSFINGSVENIDEIHINALGFAYISDRINNKIYRSFPNYDNNSFGTKPLGIIDTKDTVIARTYKGNKIYSLYSDSTLSVIDLDSKTETSISIVLDTTNIFGFSAFEDYILTYYISDNKLYRAEISYSGSVTSTEITDTDLELDEGMSVSDISYIKIVNTDTIILVLNGLTYIEYSVSEGIVRNLDNVSFENSNTYTIPAYSKNNVLRFALIDGNSAVLLEKTQQKETVLDKISLPTSLANFTSVKFIDNTAYLLDSSKNVYEIDVDPETDTLIDSGYTYYTNLSGELDNTIVVRLNDIIDLSAGIKYCNPKSTNVNHYCFNDSAIAYDYDKIINIFSTEDGNYYIETFDYDTHKLVYSKEITDGSSILTALVNPFIAKVGTVYYYCGIKSNSLYVINNSTGEVTIVSNDLLTENMNVNCVPVNNTYYIGATDSTILVFDPSEQTITENVIDMNGTSYYFDKIVKVADYNSEIYILGHNDDAEYFYLIKVDGKLNRVVLVTKTDLKYSEEFMFYDSNYGLLLQDTSGDNNSVIFSIDENTNELKIIKQMSKLYLPNESLYDNTYLDLNTTIKEDLGYYINIKYNNCYVYDDSNGVVYFKSLIDPTLTGSVDSGIVYNNSIYSYHRIFYRAPKHRIIIVIDTNITCRFVVIDTITYKASTFEVDDISLYDSSFEIIDDVYLHDETLGVTKLGHIVILEDNEVKSYCLTVTDADGSITDYTDIPEGSTTTLSNNNANITVDDNAKLFVSQNRYIGVLSSTSLHLLTLTSSLALVTRTTTGLNYVPTSSSYNLVVVNDMIFAINTTDSSCGVFLNPYNGSVYTVDSFNYTDKSVTLTSWIYEVLPLALSDSKLITNNNRIAKGSDGYNVFFDVVKYSSEYYNTYIGVDAVGQINSILVPLYSYTVDSIELNDNLNYGTLRSNDNIQVVLHLIYKTSTRNIVATIPAVSRLNTSKFSVKYNYTTANYVGEIYAFTDSENNNTLTQYDSSYYDGTYMIAILNDKFIKIKVDGDIYTYTSANNEIPLSNEILPLVVAYGDRTNSDGNTERRYLSLVDIKGNVVTYDRELKTFVDASGYVDVDVPYFSTEAVIFPSKVNNTTTIEEEVTATAE